MRLNRFASVERLLDHVVTELLYGLEEERSAMEGIAAGDYSDEARRERQATLEDIHRAEPLITHAYTLFTAAESALARLERGDRPGAMRLLRRAIQRARPTEH